MTKDPFWCKVCEAPYGDMGCECLPPVERAAPLPDWTTTENTACRG